MRTLLKFEATWCGPCQQIKPLVHDVIEQHKDRVRLQTIDVDDPANVKLVQDHRIRTIPTLVLIEDDQVINTHSGTLGRTDLEQFLTA